MTEPREGIWGDGGHLPVPLLAPLPVRAPVPQLTPAEQERLEKLPHAMTQRARRRCPPGVRDEIDWEQVEVEGQLGLWKAERTFDPARGARYVTWAMACVLRAVMEAVRLGQRLSRGDQVRVSRLVREGSDIPPELLSALSYHTAVYRNYERYDAYEELWLDGMVDPGDALGDFETDHDRKTLLSALLAALRPIERFVIIRRYWDEATHREVARDLQRAPTRAAQREQEALAKLRAEAARLGLTG